MVVIAKKQNDSELLETDSAFWHCMSLVLGLGTLTMPHVFKQLGWSAIVVLALLAWLSSHTAKLLCTCIDYIPSGSAGKDKLGVLNTYPDIGEAAFGQKGRQFVNWILYIDLVASSALFLVFVATNLEDLFSKTDSFFNIGRTGWIVVTTISLFPTMHMKLNKLSFLSQFGSYIMILLVLGVIYSALMVDNEQIKQNTYHLARFELSAIGNMVFAFSCHGTLLTIYREMKHPKEADVLFGRVYATGFLLKLVVGATGYYVFAQSVSDQISLNIPNQLLKITVTLAVTAKKWLTYALPLEPVAINLTDKYPQFSFAVRTGLVILTGILALLLPFFGLFQALVGSLCAGFLVLVFPIAFYVKLYKNELSVKSYVIHLFLLLISFILVIISSYYSLREASDMYEMSAVSEEV